MVPFIQLSYKHNVKRSSTLVEIELNRCSALLHKALRDATNHFIIVNILLQD
ncbi:unnamed protein product [Mycetohabitans rhizoxinica HKI 454]|uniref:Uncharacterized protein n=1 Tax=Mycetohabitans rhizoxinica (strain DSM 19002 / CIP 109453 / HKI 454) TaxID=882378 RepID=E5ANK5_MYCRK|nr:unnamed protein product [Mycetohabitans rhizoxinica HKI 454]